MKKNKLGCYYYDGEESNPFYDNPEAGFWRIECRHAHNGEGKEWYKGLVDVLQKDSPELPYRKNEEQEKEVVALAIHSMFEVGYYGDSLYSEITKYGRYCL